MKELLDKLKKVIHSLEVEKGMKFLICAMFLPAESYNKWDFLVSAPGLDADKLDSYRLISNKMQEYLTESESLQISRIVILGSEDDTVKFLQSLETIKSGEYKEFRPEELTDKFKFTIKRAYLL